MSQSGNGRSSVSHPGTAIPSDPEALRYDRDLTRAELSETVAALTAKLDVPARARDRMHRSAQIAQGNADRAAQLARQIPLPAVGLTVISALAVFWIVRRRRSS